MQTKEFSYKGRKLVYYTKGEGPLVVLLHGFGEDATIWKNQYDIFPGYQLVIPDLPGSGQSEMIEDMSMEGMADAVMELIKSLPAPPNSPNGEGPKAQPSLIQETDHLSGEFYYQADPITYPLLKNFVAEHRSNPTKAEELLWQQLKGGKLGGNNFRRQHIIGNYIADFICLAKGLVIEVDGLVHQLPENKEYDEVRTSWLNKKGFHVIRFTNEEVLFDVEHTIKRIEDKLNELPYMPKKNWSNKKTSSVSEVSATGSLPTLGEGPGMGTGATIIGHSMGGYITLAFAEKYPDLLSAFGLFHSTAFADSEEKKETRRKGIRFIQQHGAYEFLNSTIPNLYAPQSKEKTPQLLEEHLGSVHNFSGDALVKYYEAMIERPDRTDVLINSKVPVLFVLGRYDNAVPLEDGLKLCHLPQLSYIQLLDHSGHMGMVEEPALSNNILSQFMTQL